MIVRFNLTAVKKNNFHLTLVLRKTSQLFWPRFKFERVLLSKTMATKMCNTEDAFRKLKNDRFGGITVYSENESNDDVSTFTSKLLKSLHKWTEEGTRTVWFHVSREYSHWVPVLCDNLFQFHHVSHDGEIVIMYKWLPTNKPSSVPPYAHTMVGVGGIVLNAEQELLVVLQRYGSREILKLPGGYVEPAEDLSTAAIREVEEETGVKTKFLSCVSFRHTHGANFSCSDLYFLVHLEPLTTVTNNQSDEVVETKWISIEDFLTHPKVHELNKIFINTFLQNKKNKLSIIKDDGVHPVTKNMYSFYHISHSSDFSNQ